MIILGLILLIVGLVAAIHVLFIVGVVLLAIGLCLLLFACSGHLVGGRHYWW